MPVHATPLQMSDFLSFVFTVPTWLQWVLYVEHGGPVAIHHVLLNLVFGNVATSIFYPDTCFQVVEVAAIQLKEFNEQNADVDVGTAHILPEVKLENTQYEWTSELLQTVKGVGIHSELDKSLSRFLDATIAQQSLHCLR